MIFEYRARDVSGGLKAGELSAVSQVEATRQLRKDGLQPVQVIEKVTTRGEVVWKQLNTYRVKRSEVAYLLNQLAVLIDSGVPLATSLDSMARQSSNPRMQEVLQSLQESVEGGEALSVAMSRSPHVFDGLIVNLVRAGEASGTLPKMLERVADRSRSDIESRSQIMSALTYPLVMLSMCLGLSVFLLVYVFPKISPLFVARGISLPMPTLVMMRLSDLLRYQGVWIVGGILLLVVIYCQLSSKMWFRRIRDGVVLKLPILGKVIAKVTLCRSLRTLATTLNAGVPMLESIKLCADVAHNVHFEEIWRKAADRVSTGQPVHSALEGAPLIPSSLLQMISSGEQTGKLSQVLNRVSDFYDREVGLAFKSAMGLMEPVLIACMGSVIGTIALAMMLPVFKLSTHTG